MIIMYKSVTDNIIQTSATSVYSTFEQHGNRSSQSSRTYTDNIYQYASSKQMSNWLVQNSSLNQIKLQTSYNTET